MKAKAVCLGSRGKRNVEGYAGVYSLIELSPFSFRLLPWGMGGTNGIAICRELLGGG
jgi:hypothetical protein